MCVVTSFSWRSYASTVTARAFVLTSSSCPATALQHIWAGLLILFSTIAANASDSRITRAAECRLLLLGYGRGKAGIKRARLACSGKTPVLVSINATHLGGYAPQFDGVAVTSSSKACQVLPRDDNAYGGIPGSSVVMHALLCFTGDISIKFTELVIKDVSLPYKNSETWSTALLAIGGRAQAVIEQGYITNNYAGSALVLTETAHVVINQTQITGNHAVYGAAAIAWDHSNLLVTGSTFFGNQAVRNGGSILAAAAANVTVTGGTTISNCSAKHGGAAYVYGFGQLTFDGAIVQGNTAKVFGGGLDSGGEAVVVVNNSTWSGNSADWGGGIDTYEAVKVHIHNSSFVNNSARAGKLCMRQQQAAPW
jgi:hypothetical protein